MFNVKILQVKGVKIIPKKELLMSGKKLYNEKTMPGNQERAIVAGLVRGSTADEIQEGRESLDELEQLAMAAGAQVVGRISQNKQTPDPAWLIGKGKIEELKEASRKLHADTLIFDEELSGSQIRNIEEATGCKVIDRTFLILDIFAGRARSREGILQVELAQLQYRLSRLTGLGRSLSRLGGGIGTRGPGESKLESDRRHINRRIQHLRQTLSRVERRRDQTRQRRQERDIPTIAVVGYTNAGKSTLINQLCGSDLFVADQVFATLDPSVRRLSFEDQNTILLVDTVGLIRRLPHHLIDAFHATLEEVTEADAILEVIDVTAPDVATRMAIVEQLLVELGAGALPRFYVFNKIDLLPTPIATADPDEIDLSPSGLPPDLSEALAKSRGRPAFLASAATGQGIEALRQALSDYAKSRMMAMSLLLPYEQAGLVDDIRRYGHIDDLQYLPEGIKAAVHIRYSHYKMLRPYVLLEKKEEEQ